MIFEIYFLLPEKPRRFKSANTSTKQSYCKYRILAGTNFRIFMELNNIHSFSSVKYTVIYSYVYEFSNYMKLLFSRGYDNNIGVLVYELIMF